MRHRIIPFAALSALVADPIYAQQATLPAAAIPAATTKLILLGTASGPGAKVDRAGIATLLTVNGKHYLFDAGSGVDRQLAAAGLTEDQVDVVFLTHLHDDHTAGLPGWMTFAYTRLLNEKPIARQILGPPQVDRFVEAADRLLDVNGVIRRAEQHATMRPSDLFHARIIRPGVIYSDANITVTAMENTHFHLPRPVDANKSFSLKVKTPDRTIVLTGDTGPDEALVAFARDADILVSEMVTRKAPANAPDHVRKHIEDEHLSPQQVGRLAKAAGVRTLVLSHINRVDDGHVAAIRQEYSGQVVVGRDLMTF